MPNPSPAKRLDSWKEIAAYLKCDERTAMRWQESGLPVHRTAGHGRARVSAFTHEIDIWLAGPKPPGAASSSPGPEVREDSQHWLNRIPRIVQAGLLTVLFIVLYAATALIWKAATAAPLPLASVALRENKFVGVDKIGRALWTYPIPNEPKEAPPTRSPGIAYVGDLAGDGRHEVLVSVPEPISPGPGEKARERQVFCFSEAGDLLWRFEPQDKPTFSSGDYGPPWIISNWLMYQSKGEARIALAFNHHLWWPSMLVVLDAYGREISRFVHSGIILSLASVENSAGPLLLIGGVSNSRDHAGYFAVLDGSNPSGSSPEERGSEFECKSCAVGRPLRYYIFPRSELNSVEAIGQNRVNTIQPLEDRVEVQSDEFEFPHATAMGIFEFTQGLELKSARWSDGYVIGHRELERQGKLHHPWEKCPERFGPRLIRSWDPQHGWTEIHPQAAHK